MANKVYGTKESCSYQQNVHKEIAHMNTAIKHFFCSWQVNSEFLLNQMLLPALAGIQ